MRKLCFYLALLALLLAAAMPMPAWAAEQAANDQSRRVEWHDNVNVKMVPVAPVVRIYPSGLRSTAEVSRNGFVYVFEPAASAGEIKLELSPGDPRTALAAVNVYYAAEFLSPGEHRFKVIVQKNGRVMKQETITISVSPGRGSWLAKWNFQRFGVSLGAPRARSAEEAHAYLSRGIAAAQASFQASGDLQFDPAGTFPLPLNGTAVWTRLLAANQDMPSGRAEMITEIKYMPNRPKEFVYTTGYQGSLLPEVTLSNLPAPGGGPGPGPGGWRYWPALPATATPIVLGWALARRSVDVWLEEAESGTIYVRRGRRGPRRVRAVVTFDTGEGSTATRELVLGRGESLELQPPQDWQVVELSTPGKRNQGAPTRLEREAAQDATQT